MEEKIGVIGLGYVGMPLALSFAKYYQTVGFDISPKRVVELKKGHDSTGQANLEELQNTTLIVTSDIKDLAICNFFVVTVPTPIDQNRSPDLEPLKRACNIIGQCLKVGAIVVFESTVYPGLTEDFCGPLLSQISGLHQGIDFKLGYSPERINPGDTEHTLENIVKIVAGEDEETLNRVANIYDQIIKVGTYKAPSIKVAEAAKVIENTQRDINIALMNELSIIFARLGIRTKDVLKAAGTKWNFLNFVPGLVGGHCIGVDPYYLTAKAEQLGYYPQVILSGRRINDGMGVFICQSLVKLLVQSELPVKQARIGILGITFKENVPDWRNSRVPDIFKELNEFGIVPMVHDPLANAEQIKKEYNIDLLPIDDFKDLHGLIFAVPHRFYLDLGVENLIKRLVPGGLFLDIKSVFEPDDISSSYIYWSL